MILKIVKVKNLNIGIKYCGGCNPKYNRSALVAGITVKYKDKAKIEPIKEDVLYDMVIIMNGCSSVCVNEIQIKHRGKILSVAGEEDFTLIYEEIDKMITK
jgi:hypothetical protein